VQAVFRAVRDDMVRRVPALLHEQVAAAGRG